MEHFVTILALMGMVVVVASLLSGALERSAVPVVAVFLALGLILGPWALGLIDIGFESPALRVLATLALMMVLFSDGVTLNLKELKPRRRLLTRVLGPGTLLPAAVIAVAAHYLLGVQAPAAAILGAALTSTDPVLLRNVLRSRALPDNARIALRMETGLNDIILLPIVVIAMLVWAPIQSAHGGAPQGVLHSVLGLLLLGPVLGVIVGWTGISALSWVRRRTGSVATTSRSTRSVWHSPHTRPPRASGQRFRRGVRAGIVIDAQDSELCDCFLEYGEATAEMFLLLTFVALGTTLIWKGLGIVDWRTLLFAAIALGARSVVLYPMLGGLGLPERDRRLIALLAPRGLSTLLLALLPVFAGIPGAESLFVVACLVVLISLAVHGGGITWFLRSHAPRVAPAPQAPADVEAPAVPAIPSGLTNVPVRLTLEELDGLRAAGERVVIGDSRKDDVYYTDGRKAEGAIRLDPFDPVLDARTAAVPREATIAVYCA
jgi:NhaP-type Na+/H+ or K+/H+ antiporter